LVFAMGATRRRGNARCVVQLRRVRGGVSEVAATQYRLDRGDVIRGRPDSIEKENRRDLARRQGGTGRVSASGQGRCNGSGLSADTLA
jgi:hypothetical protein